ncbi:hypothetical protein SAMN05216198_3132 [Halopseudomonas litoralis]|uniref:Uncharacterized protein n=1 Tax=Halopseudomonas litoralis TaxID=797277 RepID=A0A1H1W377_9GAMM|nr:hypothetical protein SAMN05216198_3132 [Halopseudomonas litoralis]
MDQTKEPYTASSHSRVVMYRLPESSTLEVIRFCEQLFRILQGAIASNKQTQPSNNK